MNNPSAPLEGLVLAEMEYADDDEAMAAENAPRSG